MADLLALNGNILTSNGSALTLPTYNYLGRNPEFIKEVFSLSTKLSSTNYASWTPSTTAGSIRATSTISTKETLDMTKYDYILLWESDCNVAYNSNWTANAASCIREVCFWTQAVFRRPASVTAAETSNFYYNVSTQDIYQVQYCKYYSSATAISLANTTYSPCYISALTTPTLSNTSADSIQLTIKTPVLSARCSGTYFSTDNAAKVDQTNTTVKMKGWLYRVDIGTSAIVGAWKEIVRLYNNPL